MYEATLKSGIKLVSDDSIMELIVKVDKFVKHAKEHISDDILVWSEYRLIAVLRFSKSELKRVINIGDKDVSTRRPN